jgi:hypothetical protein
MHPTRKRLSNRASIISLALLAVLPLWIPEFPVGNDLPEHAAQLQLFTAMHAPGFPYLALFHINWFTPYLLGYMLVYVLAPLIGVIAALKSVISAALILLVLATGQLIAELDGDERLALLVIPSLYGGVFLWGFLNFLVGAPIGLYFLVCFLRWLKTPTVRRGILVAAVLVISFFAHVLICAFFGLIAVLWIWPYTRTMRGALRACLPLLPVIPLVLLWVWQNSSSAQVAHSPIVFATLRSHLWYVRMFLLGWNSRFSYLPIMVLCALPLVGYGLRRDLRYWIPLICALFVTLFAPYSLMGTAYISFRFAMFLFPMYALVFEPKAREPWRIKACVTVLVLAVLVWAGAETWRMVSFRKESQGFAHVLGQMQPGQLCVSIPIDRESKFLPTEAYLHFPAWYGALKGGVVSPSFSNFYNMLVVYNLDRPNNLVLPQEWMLIPEKVFTPQVAQRFRYELVESVSDKSSLFNGMEPRPTLRAHEGRWWLYENSTWDGVLATGLPDAAR